jgi:hypothetical protein
MTEVFLPKVGKKFRLGRNRPKAPVQCLRFKNYLNPAGIVTPPPDAVDYFTKAMSAIDRVYLNDQLGDCVFAGKMHQLGIWSANDEAPTVLATDDEVRSQYFKVCGPGDNGCNITDVLDYFQHNGLVANGQAHKIDGYVGVDSTNALEVKVASFLFGSLTIGMNLPGEWADNAEPGFTWGRTNSRSVGGHDICTAGYDAKGVKVCTWGMVGTITWDAFGDTSIIDELYAELSPDWYGDDRLAPCGINADVLRGDLAMLGGGTIPPIDVTPPAPPVPVPVPPIPVPVPGPTGWLAQVISFVHWLWTLIHGSSDPHVVGVFNSRGFDVNAIGPIVAIIIADIVKAMPVIIADVKAGKTYLQILTDVLAVLFPVPMSK